jgi:hypothetical protein
MSYNNASVCLVTFAQAQRSTDGDEVVAIKPEALEHHGDISVCKVFRFEVVAQRFVHRTSENTGRTWTVTHALITTIFIMASTSYVGMNIRKILTPSVQFFQWCKRVSDFQFHNFIHCINDSIISNLAE